MSLPRSAGASTSRRRQRSARVTVAVCLLVVAALVVTGALLFGSMLVSSAAAVLALLCGSASTRIVLNELAQSRRDAARDRAAQARAHQRLFAERVAEHDRFATMMTERIMVRDTEIGRLQATIRHVDHRVEKVEHEVKREAQRNVELLERLAAVSRELEEREDGLALWDGGEAPTVVDLLTWEERVSTTSADSPGARRHA